MKKIIAAFDGLKFSQGTLQFAIHMAKQTQAHLVGVFMDDPLYTSFKIYELVTEEGVSEIKLNDLRKRDKDIRSAAAKNFESACKHAGLEFTVHHDRNYALSDLLHESVYADLLIIDGNETLTHYTEDLPTRFVRDLLSDSQCPVLVAPTKFHQLKNLILLYDGEPSSVHAIKMFSYTLAALKHLETHVLTINAISNSLHVPDNALLKEFMKRHYPGATYTVMTGWPEEEIVKYLRGEEEQALVVLGAYRRSTVSRMFRLSMADILMKELRMPLFIAHNK